MGRSQKGEGVAKRHNFNITRRPGRFGHAGAILPRHQQTLYYDKDTPFKFNGQVVGGISLRTKRSRAGYVVLLQYSINILPT